MKRALPLLALVLVALGLGLWLRPSSSEESPVRQRLTDTGVLAEFRASELPMGASERLIDEDFAAFPDDMGRWAVVTNGARPHELDPELYRLTVGEEQGTPHLILGGTRAGLFLTQAVEPGTAYVFEARSRARGIVPTTPVDEFFGATPWLAELTGDAPIHERIAQGIEPWIHVRHLFPTGTKSEGWVSHRRAFRTGPETNHLLITCLLLLTHDVAAGEVDFKDVRLTRVPDLARRQELLATEVEARRASAPGPFPGSDERRVRAILGEEVRPALVLFPGEELNFLVQIPRGDPVFELGTGFWRPALEDAFAAGVVGTSSYRVEVEGRTVLAGQVDPVVRQADARWTDHAIELAEWAGQRAVLTLAAEGDLPCAFGAPTVRERAHIPVSPNVLLLSIDTLRADRVGSYGHDGDTTPRLDAFANESIRFADVLTQAPYTLPSHATMFSGQFPSVHGVLEGGLVLSPGRSPVLARILAQRGYRTQAFTAGGFLNRDFGFDQGFDGFATIDPLRDRDSDFLRLLVKRTPTRISRELIDEFGPERVKDWIRAHANEPFFLFLHTFTVHDYDPPDAWKRCASEGCTSTRTDFREYHLGVKHDWNPKPVSPGDAAHLGHLYDEALRYVDHLVGEILDELAALGLADRTIVCVTSDHGEEMFERGFVQHGKTLYREQTDVPLILRVPGEAARVVTTPAMLADVTPMILGALGIERDARMQGADLLRSTPERDRWSEVRDAYVHRYALIDDATGWKLIHSPEDGRVLFPTDLRWELYDLRADAGERSNGIDADPGRRQSMSAELLLRVRAFLELGESLGSVGTGAVDESTLIQLQELGYGGQD